MVVIIASTHLQVLRLHKELTQQHHRQDDTHDTQRIGDSTAQSRTTARHTQLLESLLGSTQGRCIGRGTTEDAHHVRQTHRQHAAQSQREQGAHENDRHTPKVERDTFVTHRTEEVRSHIQTEHIDKHGETEALSKLQHVMVDGQSKVTRNDSYKKDECNAKRDTFDMNLAKSKT